MNNNNIIIKFSVVFLLFLTLGIRSLEFTIIIPSYNNEQYYFRNLDSIIHQKTNVPFKVVYINDCSTDRTGQLVDAYVKHYHLAALITVVHNKKNVGALANIYNTIHMLKDDTVVLIVDGDDWLAHDYVLQRIYKEYQNSSVWLTYGQYVYYPDGCEGICKKIPRAIIQTNSFREWNRWVTSHLKTFYAGLFKRIKLEDLQYNSKFFPMANDVAMMMPMLEMASNGHISFISDVLYVYNHCNTLCNHNKNRDLQIELTSITYARDSYKPLDVLFSDSK